MTESSEIEVIAYVDGCMDAAASAAFEARMKADPALAERVAAHRWMTRQIVSAFGPPPGEEIDPALVARLGLAGANVVPFPASTFSSTSARRVRRPLLAFLASGAIAASLVAGVFIGRWSQNAPAPLLRSGPHEQVLADGALAQGLSANLAGQAGAVRIGMTFRTAQGLCRTFSTGAGLSGLGCRQGGNWVVPIFVNGTASETRGDYRLAAGEVAPAVMSAVDSRIVGDPLGPAEEQALVKRGWKD